MCFRAVISFTLPWACRKFVQTTWFYILFYGYISHILESLCHNKLESFLLKNCMKILLVRRKLFMYNHHLFLLFLVKARHIQIVCNRGVSPLGESGLSIAIINLLNLTFAACTKLVYEILYQGKDKGSRASSFKELVACEVGP